VPSKKYDFFCARSKELDGLAIAESGDRSVGIMAAGGNVPTFRDVLIMVYNFKWQE
jgi:hypothetical protein